MSLNNSLTIDLDEAQSFCEEYLVRFLVQNTSFETAAYILQTILNQIQKDRVTIQQEQIKQRNAELEGMWIIDPDGYYPVCSLCGEEPPEGRHITCPNCGARMKRAGARL